MAPALEIALLWLVFGGLHLGLTTGPVRRRLVQGLGEMGFGVLFSIAAALSFTALVMRYAQIRFDGAAGPALTAIPLLRPVLMTLAGAGVVLAVCGLVTYPRLPSALFGQRVAAPRGVERITRHPFFVGAAILALAHMLLAAHLVGVTFFGGFALLTLVGAWHQDRKLLARLGEPYTAYLGVTSIVPFAAVLSGRQQLDGRELPLGAIAAGVGAALALRAVHPALFARDGLWIVVATLAGAAVATVQAWRRAHRSALRGSPATT